MEIENILYTVNKIHRNMDWEEWQPKKYTLIEWSIELQKQQENNLKTTQQIEEINFQI